MDLFLTRLTASSTQRPTWTIRATTLARAIGLRWDEVGTGTGTDRVWLGWKKSPWIHYELSMLPVGQTGSSFFFPKLDLEIPPRRSLQAPR